MVTDEISCPGCLSLASSALESFNAVWLGSNEACPNSPKLFGLLALHTWHPACGCRQPQSNDLPVAAHRLDSQRGRTQPNNFACSNKGWLSVVGNSDRD